MYRSNLIERALLKIFFRAKVHCDQMILIFFSFRAHLPTRGKIVYLRSNVFIGEENISRDVVVYRVRVVSFFVFT